MFLLAPVNKWMHCIAIVGAGCCRHTSITTQRYYLFLYYQLDIRINAVSLYERFTE